MNKISLYFLLILIYLGMSKSFAPSEQGTPYIQNEYSLQHYFPSSPTSIILTDAFKTGFIIHTYYLRLTVVHVFKPAEDLFIRTSEKFWTRNLEYIGMSILRRGAKTKEEVNLTPMPPGILFVGDPAYGKWRRHSSGKRLWRFHSAYQSFPKLLGWGTFQPSREFYQVSQRYQENQKPFKGSNQEFGSDGYISKEIYNWAPPETLSFVETMKHLMLSIKKSLSFESVKESLEQGPSEKKSNPLQKTPSQKPLPIEKIKPMLGEQEGESKSHQQSDDNLFFKNQKAPLGELNE